jgi:hypothetical protein
MCEMRPHYRILMAASAALLAGLLSSCGSGRSVQAYCSTFYGEGAKLRGEFTPDEQQPLKSLVTLLAAPQELATFFGKLDKVAPDEIEPDVAVVRDTFQKQANSLGDTAKDPLGGALSGLVSSLSAGPAFQRVDTYTSQKCGPPPTGG